MSRVLTQPLTTSQQISAALPGVLRKAAEARAAGDTSVEALSNAFSSLEELTGAPLSARNRQAVIDGINRVYSASFVQPPPEAPAPAAPKRPQQQGGQASSVGDSKKGSVAAGTWAEGPKPKAAVPDSTPTPAEAPLEATLPAAPSLDVPKQPKAKAAVKPQVPAEQQAQPAAAAVVQSPPPRIKAKEPSPAATQPVRNAAADNSVPAAAPVAVPAPAPAQAPVTDSRASPAASAAPTSSPSPAAGAAPAAPPASPTAAPSAVAAKGDSTAQQQAASSSTNSSNNSSSGTNSSSSNSSSADQGKDKEVKPPSSPDKPIPNTPAGVASIVVPAMVGSLGFLAVLCCGLCYMRKKWKKQGVEEVLPEAHPSSKKLPEGSNGHSGVPLAESVSTGSCHAAEFK